jgi:Ca-activated chloride channel family protein
MKRSLISNPSCLILLLALLSFCARVVLGQSGRPVDKQPSVSTESGAQGEEVLRVKTEEVLLPVSVRDSNGFPVSGLEKDKFLVFDNGVRQEIASFNRQRVPANIVLLLDASSSVFSQMRFIRDAAKRFVQGLVAGDRVCVMQFSDRVELLQDWTLATELQSLGKSLDWRYHPGLRTNFYDGLYLAAEEQLKKVEGRHIIILLTDGLDTSEKPVVSFTDALNAVRRAEASVYVVSLTANERIQIENKVGGSKLRRIFSGYDSREAGRYLELLEAAENLLEGLATKTGGAIFLPSKDEDLSVAYQAIADDLRSQYIITYKPEPRMSTGQYRRVKVLVMDGEYEIGAREGYTIRD